LNNILTTIAVILVFILTAAFIGPLMINWDDYRPAFERHLSHVLGAKVELDGSLNVRFLPTPYVRVENLRFGESGIQGQPILGVKELTLWVSVPPLFKGELEASRLSLDEPKLVLQFDETGKPTFSADLSKIKGKVAEQAGARRASLSGFQLSPNLISLKDVQIKNGRLMLQSKAGGRAAKVRQLPIETVNGTLSAVTLNGPFYFNGTFDGWDETLGVRLAVGEWEKSAFPLQAKFIIPGSKEVLFTGKLAQDKKAWRALGQLKAGLGQVRNEVGLQAQKETLAQGDEKRPANEKGPQKIEGVLGQEILLTSEVALSANQALFDQIVLRGGSLAHPQTMRGKAQIDWRDALSLLLDVDGQVINLNEFFAGSDLGDGKTKKTISPLKAVSRVSDLLLQQAALFDEIDVKSKVAQLIVGKGDVSDFRLTVKSDGSSINIEEFYGRLPGSGRLNVTGAFAAKRPRQFDGKLFLRGLQFEQFLKWAAPELSDQEKSVKGKYMLSSVVSVSDNGFALYDAFADLGGTGVRGQFIHENLENKIRNRLSLNAHEVVLADLLGDSVSIHDYQKALKGALSLAGDISQNKQDVSEVEFLVDRLVFSDAVQKDVSLLWRANAQGSGLVSLSMVSAQGLQFSFDGDAGQNSAERFVVQGTSKEAVRELIGLSGFQAGKDKLINGQLIERVLPFRMAVQRHRVEGAMQYRFDGVLAGSDTAFSVLVPETEDEALPVTIFGGMENNDGTALIANLLPFQLGRSGVMNGAHEQGKQEKGTLSFSAKGSLQKGFKGQFNFEQKGLLVNYDGAVGLGSSQFASDGVLSLSGQERGTVLDLLGFKGLRLGGAQKEPLSAKMTFSQTDDGYALSDLRMAIGTTQIKGAGLMGVKEGRKTNQLALATSRLDFQTLLTPLQRGEEHGRQDKKVWSLKPFSHKTKTELDAGNEGQAAQSSFSIRVEELRLTDQLSLRDALVVWRVQGDRIELSKLSGKSLEGEFLASGVMRPVNDGYSFNGVANLKDAQLEAIGARDEVNLGVGQFSMNLSMSGSGKSVHDLVSNLVGEGSIQIKDGTLRQLSPKQVGRLAVNYLNGEQQDRANLKQALANEIDRAEALSLGSFDLGLQLIDGTIKLKQTDLGVRPGVIGVEAALVLDDLSWSGDWTIQAKGRGALAGVPPVVRRMRGKLDSDDAMVAELDMSDFERHLDLKYKEKELQALEKARIEREALRLAEERRRAEEELKRIEAEKAKLKAEKKKLEDSFSNDLDWSELPDLVP